MGMGPGLSYPVKSASLYVLQLKVNRRSPVLWIPFLQCAGKIVSVDVDVLDDFLAQVCAVLCKHPEHAFELGSIQQSLSLVTTGQELFLPVPLGNVHQIRQSFAPAKEDSFEDLTCQRRIDR
jgi:hypothetical protein